MTRRTNLLLALALSLSAAPACDEAPVGDFGDGDDIALRPGFGTSGLFLNTSALGDHPLHEIHRKGDLHEDVELEGVYIKKLYKDKIVWVRLEEVWAEHGELFGRLPNQADPLRGPELEGSKWVLYTHAGGITKREMFLHDWRYDKPQKLHKYTFGYPKDPTYGPHFYKFKNNVIKEANLMAACGGEEGSIEAVVYENLHVDMKSGAGKEMDNLINIACDGAAIAKAAEWGYRSYDLGVDRFITAVRMIRADYCGDGDSWTKVGTALDVEDIYGINTFLDPNFKTEAHWTRDGAGCVSTPRRPEFALPDVVCGGTPMKSCEGLKVTDFADGMVTTKVPI